MEDNKDKLEFQEDDVFDEDTFIKLRLRICHNGKNPNGSHFSDENIDKAKGTLRLKPLLAHVVEDEDGNIDFGSHDFKIEVNKLKDDELKIIYKEIPIGIIPENSMNYEYKEHKGRMYAYCDVFVHKDYSNYAEDLIKNSEEFKISMEIMVLNWEELEEDNRFVDITEYKYLAVTMLSDKLGTGMVDARAHKFSMDNDNLNKFENMKKSFSNYKNLEDNQDISDEVIHDCEIRFVNKDRENFDFTNSQLEEGKELKMAKEDNKEEVKVEEKFEENSEELENKVDGEEKLEESKIDEFKIIEESEEKLDPENPELGEEFEDNKDDEFVSFALTAMQAMDALDNALDGEVIRDSEGNFVQETWYWIQDYDDNYVYFSRHIYNVDGDRERNDMRATYSLGDTDATVDLENAEVVFFVRLTKEESDTLEEERSANLNNLQEEFDKLQSSYDSAMEEINKYNQRKRTKEEGILFSSYDELLKDIPEYEIIKSKSSEYETIKDLKKELALLYMDNKNILKMSKKEEDEEEILTNTSFSNKDERIKVSPYGDIFDEE